MSQKEASPQDISLNEDLHNSLVLLWPFLEFVGLSRGEDLNVRDAVLTVGREIGKVSDPPGTEDQIHAAILRGWNAAAENASQSKWVRMIREELREEFIEAVSRGFVG